MADRYAVQSFVVPTVPNGHFYVALTGGHTGTVEPDWPVDGSTVVDGDITWVDLGLLDDQTKLQSITSWYFNGAAWNPLFVSDFVDPNTGILSAQIDVSAESIEAAIWDENAMKLGGVNLSATQVDVTASPDGYTAARFVGTATQMSALLLDPAGTAIGGVAVTATGGTQVLATKLGFYNVSGVAQQTLDPDTATVADVVNALNALGLVAGP